MDVIVSAFAVVVALGCFFAIYKTSRKEDQQDNDNED
jgi:hypothetical protein